MFGAPNKTPEPLKPKATYADPCSSTFSGSLLEAILHFCYNKTLIRIKNDHFQYGPNRDSVFRVWSLGL